MKIEKKMKNLGFKGNRTCIFKIVSIENVKQVILQNYTMIKTQMNI